MAEGSIEVSFPFSLINSWFGGAKLYHQAVCPLTPPLSPKRGEGDRLTPSRRMVRRPWAVHL